MKAYTTIEQSRKLAEFLPLESADMYYLCGDESEIWLGKGEYEELEDWLSDGRPRPADIPCWSLAALLEVLPKDIEGSNKLRIDIDNFDFSIWYDDLKGYGVNYKLPDITLKEPLDACVEMIENLHKLKML